jgi:hypothetical protein
MNVLHKITFCFSRMLAILYNRHFLAYNNNGVSVISLCVENIVLVSFMIIDTKADSSLLPNSY